MNRLVFLFFTLSFCLSHGQTYLPMLEEGNYWNVIGLDGFGGPPSHVTREVIGEEVINGITYKVVENVECRYREVDGKVYAYQESDGLEYLLYDFTLEIGDFVDLSANNENYDCRYIQDSFLQNGDVSVSDKSIQFIAGEDRIVIELQAFGTYLEFWIEGIGSTTGFFPLGHGFDSASRLTCFTYEGNVYFFNDYTVCIPLGLDEELKTNITLYPNPVSNQSILQFPVEASVDKIRILDIQGRIVEEESISKSYYTIQAMNYRSGIYFYQVISEKAVLKTAQFIVN